MNSSGGKRKTLIEMIDDPADKQALIDALCTGVPNTSDFADAIEEAMSHIGLFAGKEFEGTLYEAEGEDDVLDLVLPAFRRAWGKTFASPPTLLHGDRLQMFQLLFSAQDFMEYMADILPKSKGMLEMMTELDRGSETVALVVDNYIAKNVRLSRESADIKQDIRNLRIGKTLNKW